MACRIERTPDTHEAWGFLTREADPTRIDPDRIHDLLVARDASGALVGAVLPRIDAARRWGGIIGPWTTDDAWDDAAGALLDAVVGSVPTDTALDLDADLSDERLAALAVGRGFEPGPVAHVYTLARADAGAWMPTTGANRARRATASDLPFIQDLHENEFPATYASARQLVTDPALFTLVIEREHGPVGYASGRVGASGAATLDVMAVAPSARGVGDGSRLLAAAVAELFAGSGAERIELTVEERRAPAIAFYEGHGFVRSASQRTFRRMPA